AIIGLLAPAGGTGLVTVAETTVPSGLTALLVALVPMWMVIAVWMRPSGSRPSMSTVAGLVLGFFGVALLIDPFSVGSAREVDMFGAILIVIGTISWVIGSVYSQQAHQPKSKILSAGMQMMTGGVGLLVASVFMGEFIGFDYLAVSLESWLALGYLITLGSAAFAVYMWLLSVTSAARVSTYAFVNPIIALILGSLVAAEPLSGWTLICSTMIVLSVVIVIRKKAEPDRPVTDRDAHPVGCSTGGTGILGNNFPGCRASARP
ncbi:MAG: EamA family transporter, partial [candidate division Zixibacteria bacterium]